MNIIENIREGLRSIKANLLRTILTALIISVGISSLVGILTAIDGIQSSINKNFASLGANTFDIYDGNELTGVKFKGQSRKKNGPIEYRQAIEYKQRFGYGGIVALSTYVTGTGQVKFTTKKTNPNIPVQGCDENYLNVQNFKIGLGRNFSTNDIAYSTNVVILGSETANNLFGKQNPVGQVVTLLGTQFRVVGVLQSKGNFTGNGEDRSVFLPIETARQMSGGRNLTYSITTSVPGGNRIELLMAEARGLMRQIREDPPVQPDSFVVERADAVAENFKSISGKLQIGGFGIGFITLLGASIALMNIMLVSVTERTQEIGIRKSLGATPSLIRQQFLIEAIVICILGGLAGVVLALVFGNVVAQLISRGDASFVVPWGWLFFGMFICVLVGLFSGLYPAWKASKLDPIEALRYE